MREKGRITLRLERVSDSSSVALLCVMTVERRTWSHYRWQPFRTSHILRIGMDVNFFF